MLFVYVPCVVSPVGEFVVFAGLVLANIVCESVLAIHAINASLVLDALGSS